MNIGFKEMLFQALTRRGLRDQNATAFVGKTESGVSKRSPRSDAIRTTVKGPRSRDKQVKGCNHLILRHAQVPHPRYGDRLPHFRSWVEPDPGCVHRRMPIAPVVVAAKPAETQTGSPARVPVQCSAETKSGPRCKVKTLRPSGLCKVHGG
jgi:hypothetical protein